MADDTNTQQSDDWGAGDAPAPTGQAFLTTLDLGRAAMVKAIGDGKMALPRATSRGGVVTPQTQALIADVAQYNPGFDDVDAPSRVSARKAFTSGKQGQNLVSAATALDHLATLDQAIKDLDNVSSPIPGTTRAANAVANTVSAFGSGNRVTNYRATVAPQIDELVRAFRGAGGNEADIKRLESAIPENGSPEQQRGAIQQWAKLLAGRIDELNRSYNVAMGTSGQTAPGLSAHAQQLMQQFTAPDYAAKGLLPPTPPAGGGDQGGNGPSSAPTNPAGGNGAATPWGQEDQPQYALKGDGTRTFSTDQDKSFAAATQALLANPKTTRADFDALAAQYSQAKFGADLDRALEVRAKNPNARINVNANQSGRDDATALSKAANIAKTAGYNLANAGSFGLVNKVAAGVDALGSRLGGDNRSLGDIYDQNLAENNLKADLAGRDHPYAALGGNIAGFVTGGAALGKFARAAEETIPTVAALSGKLSPFARGVTKDATYGGLYGAGSSDRIEDVPGNIAKDAALFGGGSAVGRVAGAALGRYVAEPIASAALNSRFGPTIENTLAKAPFKIDVSRPPSFTPEERSLNASGADLGGVTANLRDADRLGLPYSLADADPRLRALAGSATRLSPEALAKAEPILESRSLGQADRAVNAIDQRLAPITDITARGEEIMANGAKEYKPLYEQAYQAPVISSPELDNILATPAGRQAVARANTIAANEFRNPRALGFVQDADGNVMLNAAPTKQLQAVQAARGELDAAQDAYREALKTPGADLDKARAGIDAARQKMRVAEADLDASPAAGSATERLGYTTHSLDYVKRGLDDILEQQRNPVTGKLELDEAGRAINDVKNRLLDELDNLNPAYRNARQSYQGYAQQRQALGTGHDVLPSGTLPMRDFERITGRATDETRPELQRGYATAMADQASRARLSADPYRAVYGSPDQQAKVAALFPDGARDFGRTAALESDMAKTAREVLGGSPTARRQAADAALKGDLLEHLGNAGVDVALTGAPIRAGVAALRHAVSDRAALGFGARGRAKAEALADVLLRNSNPADMADLLDALAAKNVTMSGRQGSFGATFSRGGRALTLGDIIRNKGAGR